MMAAVPPSQLAAELTKSLTAYGKDAAHEVDSILQEIGEEAKDQLTAASPKRTGKYRRGWKVQVSAVGLRTEVTVHNSRYQLTHLLENGHRTRLKHGKYGGKRMSAAAPHIDAVNTWAQQEALRRIKKALGG